MMLEDRIISDKTEAKMGTTAVPQRFVSEPITPVTETCDTSRMAIGEPGLPRHFLWRGRTVKITAVLRSWRSTGKCRHGSPEMYVRKHWYKIATANHGVMTIYFDRQPRHGRKAPRWWLFSIEGPEKTAKEPL